MVSKGVDLLAKGLWRKLIAPAQLRFIGQNEHHLLPVTRAEADVLFEHNHEACPLLEPYVKFDDEAHGIKARVAA